jgi:hypothetical protein
MHAVSFDANPATYWVRCESFIVIICPDLQKLVADSKVAVVL